MPKAKSFRHIFLRPDLRYIDVFGNLWYAYFINRTSSTYDSILERMCCDDSGFIFFALIAAASRGICKK